MTKLTPKAQADIRETIQVADRELDTSESQIAEKALAAPASQPLVHRPITPMEIIADAVHRGMDTGKLKELVELHERMEAKVAEKAFRAAMANFKATRPPIVRQSRSQFDVTRDGVKVPRLFADLEDIESAIGPCLAENGLSYRYGDMIVSPDGKLMTLECIIEHTGGHVEKSKITMPLESSGGSSAQQKYGIANTYGMRYGLKNMFGLTDVDPDTDGAANPETITENQAANLQAALDGITTDKGRQAKFLAMFGVQTFAAIPLTRFGEALAWVEKARKAGVSK